MTPELLSSSSSSELGKSSSNDPTAQCLSPSSPSMVVDSEPPKQLTDIPNRDPKEPDHAKGKYRREETKFLYDFKAPKQVAKAPKQGAKTPKQVAKTPKQGAKTIQDVSKEDNTQFEGTRRIRPDWAGLVKITMEPVSLNRHGEVERPVYVKGYVCPIHTTGRQDAPEPLSTVRVSQSSSGGKQPKSRNYLPTPDPKTGLNARNQGIIDVQKGHLMALELGGPDIKENIVPQFANWQANGEEWRKMEKEVEQKARNVMIETRDHALLYEVEVIYRDINPEIALLKHFGFPKGFITKATEYDLKTNKPVEGGFTKTWPLNQRQDTTDEKIAFRTEVALMLAEGQGVPPWEDLGDVVGEEWLFDAVKEHLKRAPTKEEMKQLKGGIWPYGQILDKAFEYSDEETEKKDDQPLDQVMGVDLGDTDDATEEDDQPLDQVMRVDLGDTDDATKEDDQTWDQVMRVDLGDTDDATEDPDYENPDHMDTC